MGIVEKYYCPECGAPIMYNGNYYCIKNEHGEKCWIMDPDDPDNNLIKAYLQQELTKAIKKDDKKEIERMEFYLARMDDH